MGYVEVILFSCQKKTKPKNYFLFNFFSKSVSVRSKFVNAYIKMVHIDTSNYVFF